MDRAPARPSASIARAMTWNVSRRTTPGMASVAAVTAATASPRGRQPAPGRAAIKDDWASIHQASSRSHRSAGQNPSRARTVDDSTSARVARADSLAGKPTAGKRRTNGDGQRRRGAGGGLAKITGAASSSASRDEQQRPYPGQLRMLLPLRLENRARSVPRTKSALTQ